jgi:hypothetical protein
MNDYDRNNLMFLMHASKEQLAIWSLTVTEDDLDYAMELLKQYSAEMTVREMELDEMFDEGMAESTAVLERIMKM